MKESKKTTIVKLSEVEFGAKVMIGGFEFEHKGFDKRKINNSSTNGVRNYSKEVALSKVERYFEVNGLVTRVTLDEFLQRSCH